jgi:60 kDa SS-A/Ro ribonucleoprotein
MANKNLFNPKTRNEAGGNAYAMAPKQALAQYAATGCLNGTFYATANEQLANVLALCERIEPAFIARTAVYCRERGFMKDMPALLCAVLAKKDVALLQSIFPRVIDNGKMLRNFVQIVRSGAVGRRSLGTAPKRMVGKWIEEASDSVLLRASVGKSPSLADVIRLAHPKPAGAEQEAFFAWIVGRAHDHAKLPSIVRELEAFRRGESLDVPDVPFEMLTSLPLTRGDWKEIARNAPWQMTRMNLNTFARHEVFEDEELTLTVAMRLADAAQIRKARVFPYQLLAAYLDTGCEVPEIVRDALQDALEVATGNVPAIEGKVFICPDVSGSMASPVTGTQKGATTSVRCVDVAALVTASIVRKNAAAEVLPFSTQVDDVQLNRRDSVMTNAEKLAAICGGGTRCSAPLAQLNAREATGDLVMFVSDNESWADPQNGRGTKMMREWEAFRVRNPKARLVCIDVQPYATTQVEERKDVLNVGGFSDSVFELVSEFAAGRLGDEHWIKLIEST